MKARLYSTLALSTLLLSACSHKEPIDDIHLEPRETKAWESVDISSFGQQELLQRLELLVSETQTAATAEQPIEFHHLEVAFTPTLMALRDLAGENEAAVASIDKLLPLAIKLHEAGHAGNSDRGGKIGLAMGEIVSSLKSQL